MNTVVSTAVFSIVLYGYRVGLSDSKPVNVYSPTGGQIPLISAKPPDGDQEG